MKNTIIQVTCDICGKDAPTQDIPLQFMAQRVSIDLCSDHLTKLDKALAPYLEAGRKERVKSNGKRAKRDTKAIRAWAQENGHPVAGHGRIPQEVEAAYLQRSA
jgi:hypothetical protein